MWLRRHFVAFAIFFAALVTIADGSLTRAETHRMEPCGVALIGACLPRRVAAGEQTQGTIAETTQGFTLLEIAIVLMVIGLIVGGILFGQDLIKSAQTQQEISEVSQFYTAVDAFVTKYAYLPGDIPDPYASQFGFLARGPNRGEGDGNGLWEDYFSFGYSVYGCSGGETAMVWVDLSTANMLGKGTFNTATPTGNASSNNDTNGPPVLNYYLPQAKIGNGNYLYAWSGGPGTNGQGGDGKNYFSISQVTDCGQGVRSNPGMTVAQAFAIDKKMDDGLPQSGNVQAFYLNWGAGGNGFGDAQWAIGGSNSSSGATLAGASSATGQATTAATPGTANTCYDNNSGSGPQQYSMEQNNGSGVNCALSFRMQGAAR